MSRPKVAGSAAPIDHRTRPCPVCGSTAADDLYRQRFATFARGSIAEGYDVVSCRSCGACFATDLPDPERFAQYYADSSKYDLSAVGAELSSRDVGRYVDEASFVAKHVPDKSSPVLDVGTATGGFLHALSGAGFERLYGVDPSPSAVGVARGLDGINVAIGGLDAARTFGVKFGLVSYVAVLEHVLEPRLQVRAVTTQLQPGGYVFVCVPDAGSFKDHIAGPYQEFSVEHINFFTGHALANLMAAEGYSLVAERSVVLPFGSNGMGAAIEAIYRWDASPIAFEPDLTGSAAVREYIRRSDDAEAIVRERIDRLAVAGDRIYVWGTGTHTLHLLHTSRLSDCRIEAFVDSNPQYAGATLAGRPVIAPHELAQADAPILVSSAVSQTGIVDAARARFGTDVALILLY